MMTFFDVDSHVEECEATWQYLDSRFADRRPQAVTVEDRKNLFGQNAFWLIDGAAVPRVTGRGLAFFGTPTASRFARAKPFSIGSQELTSVDERLADLDRYGIDRQIVNSSLFNTQLTPDIVLEQALAESYNTWISKACAPSAGRLQWTAVMRLRDVNAAIRELHRVAALGAIAFVAIVGTGIAERFPRLRFAFVEAGAAWVPWLVDVMEGYWRLGKGPWGDVPDFGHSATNPREIVRSGSIYVVCEAEEPLHDVLEVLGVEHVMLGSDMPHPESHPNALDVFRRRDDLDSRTKTRILSENALCLFGGAGTRAACQRNRAAARTNTRRRRPDY
jgi:predicted TIM-barrel fold metal-dependent hydrolase